MNRKNWLKFSELEPMCVLRLILQNLWLVILAALIGFLSTSAFRTADISRSYVSSATFVVTPVNTGYYRNLSTAIRAAETYSPLLESKIIYQIVDEALEEDCTGTIQSSQLGKTNLISVSVTSANPRDSLLIMQAIAENHGQLSQYVSASAKLELLNTPSLAVRKATFGGKGLVLYATVGCAAAMIGLLFLVALSGATVQTADSAAQLLDAQILGTIPHEKQLGIWLRGSRRSNKVLHVTSPNVSFAFAEAIHRIAGKFEQEKSKGNSVFLLTSVSESEGKSTVAANVALSLAMKKTKVLLIDLDLRRPVQAKNLRLILQPEEELGAMLAAGASPETMLSLVKTEPVTGMHALLSCQSYKKTVELISSANLRELVQQARSIYDYIIIDLPPVGYFSESEAMLELADCSALVTRQDVVPYPVITDNIDALREGRAAFLRCILNDVYTLSPASSRYGYGYGRYGYGKYGYSGSGESQAK